MSFEDHVNINSPRENSPNYTKTFPAWVHDLIAGELDGVIERHRQRVEPASEKEQETVNRRPK